MGQAHGEARLTDSHRFEDSAVQHLLISVPGIWGLPKTRGGGVPFWGPHKKDSLRSPVLGNYHLIRV